MKVQVLILVMGCNTLGWLLDLRFADDVLPLARIGNQCVFLMDRFRDEVAEVPLLVNPTSFFFKQTTLNHQPF